MRARAVVSLRFEDEATAKAVALSTAVDNPPAHAAQSTAGRKVTLEAHGPTLPSLRETLDDWLRCAATAAEAARRAR